MSNQTKKNKVLSHIVIVTGSLGLIFSIISIGFALADSKYSIYNLAFAIIFLGANRIFLHIAKFKNPVFESLLLTVFVFVLAVLVSLTGYSIYFLIVSFFGFGLSVVIRCIISIYNDRSIQTVIRDSLIIIFAFTYTFIFFFPSIYLKHATSVSNSNFIVLSYSLVILLTCLRNSLAPLHYKWKINILVQIIKKTLAYEIVMGLFVLILFCSVYFLTCEPNIGSFVDALWYCFAVITTIGFGDISVTTTFGRILSVILGIYGIAMVALFTSLIVNLYNVRSKKRDTALLKEIKDIKKETAEIKQNQEQSLEDDQ